MGPALSAMASISFLLSRNYQEQQWRAERKGAHPNILIFEKLFVRRMAKVHNVPVFAHNMIRDLAHQQRLYDQGVSKATPGKSPHQYGCAVDIVHGIKAWDLTEQQWRVMGHVGHELAAQLGIKVVWGGNDGPGDKFAWDPAHWQLANWRDVKKRMDDAEWDSEPVTAWEVAFATKDVCLRAREERWPDHLRPYPSVPWQEVIKRPQ